MHRIRIKASMTILALLFGSWMLNAASTKPLSPVVLGDSSDLNWLNAYADWLKTHPAALSQAEADSGQNMTILRTPFLAYYAQDGNILYISTDIDASLSFLNKLPQVSHPVSAQALQPTLAEYLSFFPSLAPYKDRILAGRRPVLLAVCDKGLTAKCKQQNDALEAFKPRAGGLKVQVVQISLIRNAPNVSK